MTPSSNFNGTPRYYHPGTVHGECQISAQEHEPIEPQST
jgi:hypothetical protein